MRRLGALFTRRKARQEIKYDNENSEELRKSCKIGMDYLKLDEETQIQNILQEGEQVIFSNKIDKFNSKNKLQSRSIMITSYCVYNLKGLKMKEKVEIQKIKKIITSRLNSEFILSVPEENDFRYTCEDNKKQLIIEILCQASHGLQILYADQAELQQDIASNVNFVQQDSSSINKSPSLNCNFVLPNTLNQGSNNTNSTKLRNSIQNNAITFNLSPISNHLSPKQDEDKNIQKERKLKKFSTFERCIQMNFNDFEMIEYLGYSNPWRYFRVKECGNQSKKVYLMRVINTYTHLKKDESTHKQFVQEQVQLIKELDSSYFSQQYYYIDQNHHFAILQEELDTEKYIDLAQLIDEQSFLPENIAKVIAAQIAYSLDTLHKKNIAYNQVNPQDIKIDLAGNTILTRFEFSKLFNTKAASSPRSSITQMFSSKKQTNQSTSEQSGQLSFSSSIFNTDDSPLKQSGSKFNSNNRKIDYFSPEMIKDTQNSSNTDWWSFGVLLYELLLGFTPFYHQDENKMKDKIFNQKDIFFPKMANISQSAKNLIIKCLDKNSKTRIKNSDILNHEFFTGIKWAEVKERVPQYEVSQLFNLEKRFSDIFQQNTSSEKEAEDNTGSTVDRDDRKNFESDEDDRSMSEDEEETIILREVKNIGKNDQICCCDNLNMMEMNSLSLVIINQA